MKNMIIKQCVLGMVCTNCYFLMNQGTKELLIVDPADEPVQIVNMVKNMEGKPVAILLTHGHYDHMMAVEEIRKQYGIPVYACQAEDELLRDPMKNLTGYEGQSISLKADELVRDGQQLVLAGFSVEVLHTPGHTAGSCCYYFKEEDILISGDTLFYGSVGRTDLPTGNMRQIVESLHRLLDKLPEETQVLPGHGSFTTIENEKRYNPFV